MSPSHISALTFLQYLMFTLFSILVSLAGTNAHMAAFARGMFCQNGTTPGVVNQNANQMVYPVYMLTFDQWFFNAVSGCTAIPPPDGEFLELPAGGVVEVQIASNQGQTNLSFGGEFTSAFVDGKTYPLDNPYNYKNFPNSPCITSPNLHTQNASMAAGTAFAISYVSNLKDVTLENLVIFSVLGNTPWLSKALYDVPADMPPCPDEGCICAWGWVPNGCGQPNMYMEGFKCKVTGSTKTTPLGSPKPPVWCQGNPAGCTKGPKQFIAWHQLDGNNVEVDGLDLSGFAKSPGYNSNMGFSNGAQNDIFAEPTNTPAKAPTSANAPTKTPTKAPTKAVTKAPTKTPTTTPTKAQTKISTKTPTKTPTDASNNDLSGGSCNSNSKRRLEYQEEV